MIGHPQSGSNAPSWASGALESGVLREKLTEVGREVEGLDLAPMLAVRRAWADSGLAVPWVGASYPDVVNTILGRLDTVNLGVAGATARDPPAALDGLDAGGADTVDPRPR